MLLYSVSCSVWVSIDQYGSVWVSMGQYGSIWVSVGPFLPLGSVQFVEEGERKLHCCEYD